MEHISVGFSNLQCHGCFSLPKQTSKLIYFQPDIHSSQVHHRTALTKMSAEGLAGFMRQWQVVRCLEHTHIVKSRYDSLSLRFNGHFPGEPELAGVYWSKGWWRWWWQLNYRSYKLCHAPVKSSPPTNQHPVFLQAGCPSCRPTNSVKELTGKRCDISQSIKSIN